MFTDPRTAEEESRLWTLMFVVIALVAAISGFLRTFCFALSGEALTARLRSVSFKAIMRQVNVSISVYHCARPHLSENTGTKAISRLTVVSRAAKKLQSARPIKRRAATTVSYLRVGPVSQY